MFEILMKLVGSAFLILLLPIFGWAACTTEERAVLEKAGTGPNRLEQLCGEGGRWPSFSSARTKELKAGMVIKDCAECPEMVVIPAGSFDMGDPNGDVGEKPVHRVHLDGFALARTELTQGQWRAIMGANPSYFDRCGDNCPVEQVSWNDAQAYLRALSARTGRIYRLPTEAEWEYACRAGERHEYCGSNNAESVGWNSSNSGYKIHGVAEKMANAFGLYDMSGNVWEWTEDCFHDNYHGAPSDGGAWRSDCDESRRVLRGGSWYSLSGVSHSGHRFASQATSKYFFIGFRPARMLSD